MRIVVDAQLPFAAETFAGLGEVVRVPTAQLDAAALRDADAAILRSVTPVNVSLLDGSPVRFVGTATSGIDHVDVPYLRRAGIGFADAAGCNAVAVAEYVAAALFHACSARNRRPEGLSIGIVGCGHVGRAVARFAAALGMRVVMNDPPLARATCEPVYRPLDEALACDVVSLHVPLERGGLDPTRHLANAQFFHGMKPGAIFINASRGAVVDSVALKSTLESGRLGGCVLDVWENEPDIDAELFAQVTLGTAHIAGLTLDAKRRALEMLRTPLARNFDLDSFVPISKSAETPVHHVTIDAHLPKWDAVENAVRASFDIEAETDQLRDALQGTREARIAGFEALRSGDPVRREFSLTEVGIDADHEAIDVLRALGFRVNARVAVSAGARS